MSNPLCYSSVGSVVTSDYVTPLTTSSCHQSSLAEIKTRADARDPELTENHPVTRRDENDITAFELAALHHEVAVGGELLVFAGRRLVHRWPARRYGGSRETDPEPC